MIQFPPINAEFLTDFHSPIAGLGGPTGTGKTFTLGQKLLTAATLQRAHRGIRKTHFLIARPSEGDVKESMVKDLEDEILAEIKEANAASVKFTGQYPIKGMIRFLLSDKTEVRCEITAAGFEDAQSAKRKLKSKKYTCAFLPEMQTFSSEEVVTEIIERINRFPTDKDGGIYWEVPMSDGSIATFPGGRMWYDFNYTDKRHWFYKYSVTNNLKREDGTRARKIYKQPPVLKAVLDPQSDHVYKGDKVRFVPNQEAKPYIQHQLQRDEKGEHILDSEYDHWLNQVDQMMGKDAKIDENIMGVWGYRTDGKPVYPKFSMLDHVSEGEVAVNRAIPVTVGVDNGFNNAFVFGQEGLNGKLVITDEVNNVAEASKPMNAALDEDVMPLLNNKYFGCEVTFILDPAMNTGEGARGNTQEDEFRERGLKYRFAPTQNPLERIKDGAWFINQRGVLEISSNCTDLVAALAGGYNYKLRRHGLFDEKPDKNSPFSHIGDAYQYLCSQLRRGFSRKGKKKRKRRSFYD